MYRIGPQARGSSTFDKEHPSWGWETRHSTMLLQTLQESKLYSSDLSATNSKKTQCTPTSKATGLSTPLIDTSHQEMIEATTTLYHWESKLTHTVFFCKQLEVPTSIQQTTRYI